MKNNWPNCLFKNLDNKVILLVNKKNLRFHFFPHDHKFYLFIQVFTHFHGYGNGRKWKSYKWMLDNNNNNVKRIFVHHSLRFSWNKKIKRKKKKFLFPMQWVDVFPLLVPPRQMIYSPKCMLYRIHIMVLNVAEVNLSVFCFFK